MYRNPVPVNISAALLCAIVQALLCISAVEQVVKCLKMVFAYSTAFIYHLIMVP